MPGLLTEGTEGVILSVNLYRRFYGERKDRCISMNSEFIARREAARANRLTATLQKDLYADEAIFLLIHDKNVEEAEAALEDLEKSIVGQIADDVVVGIKGDRVEMIITKKF